jgi:hypothetical protein
MRPKIIYLDLDDYEFLKSLPKREASEYVRMAIKQKRERDGDTDIKQKQIKQHKQELQKLQSQLEKQKLTNQKKIDSLFNNLSEAKYIFISDARKKLKLNPLFYEGKFKAYNNLFGEITKKDFDRLLNDLKIPKELENKNWEEKY